MQPNSEMDNIIPNVGTQSPPRFNIFFQFQAILCLCARYPAIYTTLR